MFALTIFGYVFSAFWITLFAFLWVIIAIWPGLLAKQKGYSFWLFFLLSLPFWWITFFVALFIRNKNLPQAAPASSAPAAPTPPASNDNTID